MTNEAEQLERSWDANAAAWARTIRELAIESRRVATDAAILEAVLSHSPRRVLDAGCGEGWLARALVAQGVSVVGVDGSLGLIEAARASGAGEYRHVTYDDLVASPAQLDPPFDAVVSNFALLHEDIQPLLQALGSMLAPGGVLLIQTVHPWAARGEHAYANGWRTEVFPGLAERFEPMPWYFRTLSSWLEVLRSAGLAVRQIQEPVHPETKEPLSLLLVAHPDAQRGAS